MQRNHPTFPMVYIIDIRRHVVFQINQQKWDNTYDFEHIKQTPNVGIVNLCYLENLIPFCHVMRDPFQHLIAPSPTQREQNGYIEQYLLIPGELTCIRIKLKIVFILILRWRFSIACPKTIFQTDCARPKPAFFFRAHIHMIE